MPPTLGYRHDRWHDKQARPTGISLAGMSEESPTWSETAVRATLAAIPYVGGSIQVVDEDVRARRAAIRIRGPAWTQAHAGAWGPRVSVMTYPPAPWTMRGQLWLSLFRVREGDHPNRAAGVYGAAPVSYEPPSPLTYSSCWWLVR
jgi:hypothetical protein